MTTPSQQPRKAYIITENEIKEYEDYFYNKPDDLLRMRQKQLSDSIRSRPVDAADPVLEEALTAIDDCWRRMHHGRGFHHHKMKRDLFLRFRKCVEALRRNPKLPEPARLDLLDEPV